jgi:hypothetical protein
LASRFSSNDRVRRHRLMLILCSLAIATSPMLTVLPDERVSVCGVKGLVLPATCMSREIFGTTCPGCGLTRSFVYIAHGEWSDSLRVNRIGWIVMALAFLQIPYRAHALWGSGRIVLGPVASKWFGMAVIAIIIGSWLIGLLVE